MVAIPGITIRMMEISSMVRKVCICIINVFFILCVAPYFWFLWLFIEGGRPQGVGVFELVAVFWMIGLHNIYLICVVLYKQLKGVVEFKLFWGLVFFSVFVYFNTMGLHSYFKVALCLSLFQLIILWRVTKIKTQSGRSVDQRANGL